MRGRRAGEFAHPIKHLQCQSDGPSSVSGTHINVNEENQLLKRALCPPHVHHDTHVSPHCFEKKKIGVAAERAQRLKELFALVEVMSSVSS